LETDLQALFPLTKKTPVQLIAGFPDNIFEVATQMIAATMASLRSPPGGAMFRTR
jgi:hypothetical protein